jgi:hypothetical protein
MTDCNRFGSHTLDTACKQWQLTNSKDAGILDDYVNESLAIAGADINVYKLLGVHEQGLLVDLAGNGTAISGGTANGSSANNAFVSKTDCCVESSFWRSSQKGSSDILSNAFIGYDFGVPKLTNGRNRYGVDVDIKNHITTIKIQQSTNEKRRALKMRVERSDDGIKWFGVDIITLQDNDSIQQIGLKQSATTRYWRLRPITFTGTDSDFWEIQRIQLIDWDQTNLFQVQDDYGWIENRDRDYADNAITIKGFYDLFDKDSDLSKFGFISTGGAYNITANFNDLVNRIGRPIVIGDVLELPSQIMYDPNMKPIKKYLEVTDVSWAGTGWTPGWKPTLLRITAEPMLAKQETMDIVGDMVGAIDKSGLFEIEQKIEYSQIHKTSERSREQAEKDVGLRGSDTSEIRSFEQDEIDAYAQQGINVKNKTANQTALYVEDAIPPNGLPYTEGTTYPLNPKDKDYHRLTYVGLSKNIPARLYRYSGSKQRWIYLETDLRQQFAEQVPFLQNMKQSETAISSRNIQK